MNRPFDINLAAHERRVFSQNGEDGVIERIFEMIGTTNKVAVELGISEVRKDDNTRTLRDHHGWEAVWFDCQETPGAHLEFITAENVNPIFAKYSVPQAFDLLSIDINGVDYWVWKALEYRPRVVVMEYNASVPPDKSLTVPYDPAFAWDHRMDFFGVSLLALERLGRRKGYALVYCESHGLNAFFVERELIGDVELPSVASLFRPPKYGPRGDGLPHSDRAWEEVEQEP